ncbi:acyltransferase family protein [Bosea robiniae]|uniref:Peptidoglycan/LPS O-acetylase OafA/YrhL, contains acyltransferase and SGNH-hydrolase domains n=1 Tax=Bosea robiniae TaxID=1036780 RepID=A0ABY0NMP4_9HYPH|nr:acyltransferase [Bosea robiniae]SDF80317.1 Peptidoglycan/LPS O-acetylase OafA/YrhL, contains acyltransferase and SGNH-hydrolase domains [Bosea robiniae]
MQPIHSIQVLRALAAFMVAIHHVQPDAAVVAARGGLSFTRSDLLPWMAGVDIFFVVSGFIMVHASQDLFGRDGASRLFLKRRLARIVPLYWAVTTLFLLVGFAVPAVLNSGVPSLQQIVGSYLFWPVVSTQGFVQPVYSLGWTLNYEMLFYVLFAAGLMLPRRWTLPAITLVLALLVAAESLSGPLALPLGFWGQPIVLEFAAGMGIAVLWQKGLRLHGALRIAVAIAGAALLVAAAHIPGADGPWSSVLWRGGAAVLLMLAAGCGREGIVPLKPVKALAAVGDASYALYLVHPFVIRGMREVVLRLGLHSPMLYIALALAGSVIAALLLYRFFEKPATRLARRWLGS